MKMTITFHEDCPMHKKALDFLRAYKKFSHYDYSSAVIQFILLAEAESSFERNVEISLFRGSGKDVLSVQAASEDKPSKNVEELVNQMDSVSEDLLRKMSEEKH